ncbi:hypothetical protein GCM10009850_122380 [Nonomuraea monospora]|uniref:peptidylprolyl isomerase n=1 Tax=Nonomuraea monospora TaxID=568818 RepID=A0ABN3D5F6_9ACTN
MVTTAATPATLRLAHRRSAMLDLFLALQRELMGRFPHELAFLPCPAAPEVAQFMDGLKAWKQHGLNDLPSVLAHAERPHDLIDLAGEELREGSKLIAQAMAASEGALRPAIEGFADLRESAVRDLGRLLELEELDASLRAALGIRPGALVLPLHLVPLAPHFPGVGVLMSGRRMGAGYADCRRFLGSTLADAVLTLLAWTLLRALPGPDSLPTELARRLPGKGRHQQRLRVVLTKILIEMTVASLIRARDPEHRSSSDVLGTAWRYPRLFAVAQRHWQRYLAGAGERAECLDGLATELAATNARWWVEDVDAASLAADFYLLEWLRAEGDAQAARSFASWTPRLADYLARQIDLTIGGELGHFERGRHHGFPEPVGSFIQEVTTGDSRVAWWRARRRLGESRALALAVEAFNGPGVEYGGEAWGPVAATLRRYVDFELPPAVFVDQCFTLEHNNGSLFDKYFATDDLRAVLDNQAAGDLAALAARASEEVRRRWQAHTAEVLGRHDPAWLGLPSSVPAEAANTRPPVTGHPVGDAPIGALGCGNAADAAMYDDERHARPVAIGPSRRRRPHRPPHRRITGARVVLHLTTGPVRVELWARRAPHTVDTFIGLAEGTIAWTDPLTRQPGSGGFYDGTPLFRRVPGFVVQGGDRTGTGERGAGFRILDEFGPDAVFDRPYLMAMVNTGPNSAGSQFFLTLAVARHLDGRYCQFGEVTDPASQRLLDEAATEPGTVSIVRVEVTTW